METRMIDQFYLNQAEPQGSCLQALRDLILRYDEGITEAWKYRMPMFCYQGKMFCYLWLDNKTQQPYLGVVEGKRIDHPLLVAGKRSRMKVLYFDPQADIPVAVLYEILDAAKVFYKKKS